LQTVSAVRGEIFTADGADHGFFNNPPWYERTLYRADEFLASVGYIKGLPTISRPSHTPGSSQDRPPPPNTRLVRPAEKRGRSAAGR
jgi:hypothetical protein